MSMAKQPKSLRTTVVAELGANHCGDIALSLRMIDAAKAAGADVIKFQKRDPSMMCVPETQRDVIKETPWGALDYVNYRRRLEFGREQYDVIDRRCRILGIPWTASVWDEPSVAFLGGYDVPFLKIPSAALTNIALLRCARCTGSPLVASVGMSIVEEIDAAVEAVGTDGLTLLWCRSTYPAALDELNLEAIRSLRTRYQVPIGFSNHYPGLFMTLCAVALGAVMVEVHFTLDRSSWGTDQAASVEPRGFAQLVRQIRNFEQARGDGRIGPTASEASVRARLRRVP